MIPGGDPNAYYGPTNPDGKPVEQHHSDFKKTILKKPRVMPTYSMYDIADDGQNLSSLFSDLNLISARNQRAGGGGRGGGSEALEGNMDANRLIALSDYMGENVTSFNKGGQLTPKEYKKVQKLGRFGDTQLAHVTPEESAMLKAMGGSGTINPYTGLQENWGFFKALADVLTGATDVVRDIVDPVVENVVEPIFDVAGNVMEPVHDVAHEGVSAVGGLVEKGVEGIASGGKMFLDMIGDAGHDVLTNINDILGLGDSGSSVDYDPYTGKPIEIKREAIEKVTPDVQKPTVGIKGPDTLSALKKSAKPSDLAQGDWVGDKENPFVTPNVEEELDYAAKGMRMPRYNQGGHYLRQANQAIAMNQLSGLVANVMNKRMPQANYGMKMKKRYTNGGRF